MGAALLAVVFAATACSGAPDSDGVEPGLIPEMAVEAQIHPDGTMDVQETVTYDFGPEPSPGLFRALPVLLDSGPIRDTAMSVTDVAADSPTGADTTIERAERVEDEFLILIGDSSEEVTGEHTYVISYTVDGALEERSFTTDLGWGFVEGWGVPIEEVSIEVEAPAIDEASCQLGTSVGGCEEVEHTDTTVSVQHERLSRNMALSLLVAMPNDSVTVNEPQPTLRHGWAPSVPSLAIAATVLVLAALLFVIRIRRDRKWRSKFGDKVPEGLTPGGAGYLFGNRRLKPLLVLAMLIDLEERGLVKARPDKENPDNWLFSLQVSKQSRKLNLAERSLVSRGFTKRGNARLTGLRSRLSPRRQTRISLGLEYELRRFGLTNPWLGPRRLLLLLPFLCVPLVGVAVDSSILPFSGFYLVLVAAAVYGASHLWNFGVSIRTARGQHLYDRLKRMHRDTARGGPLSVADQPAWSAALGVPNEVLGLASGLMDFKEEHANRDGDDRGYRYDRRGSRRGGGRSGGGRGGGGGRGAGAVRAAVAGAAARPASRWSVRAVRVAGADTGSGANVCPGYM
ncbi:DUF2207 domain-containing protein [Nocardiopsis oceani]